MQKFFLTIITSIILCSCGFKVIYKERDSDVEISFIDELAKIRIEKDRSKLGQTLKGNLYELFNPGGVEAEPKYFLSAKLISSSSPTYITLTGASGRDRASISVNYTLKSLKNGVTISTGSTNINDNYDITQNRYASYRSNMYVLDNLTRIAAQNVRNSIVNDLIELRRKCVNRKADEVKEEDEAAAAEEKKLADLCEAL